MSKSRKHKKINIYVILPLALSLLVLFQVIRLNAIPFKILIPAFIVLFLILLLIYLSQHKKRKSKALKTIGKILSVLISLLLLVGNVYLYKTGSFLDLISGGDEMIDTVSVVVMKENSAENIKEVIDGNFGIEDDEEDIIKETIEHINKENQSDIMISQFNSYGGLVNYLYQARVDAIIINEAFRDVIKEEHPDFDEETKVIYSHKIKKKIKKPIKTVDVTKDSFNVLISGIDVYGSISNNSRSDVNILATVNPRTKDILLTAVPRDYYLPMPCQGGTEDKLTHSGIYGVDCTMETLGNAFDIDVEHYVRVNFSSFTQVIDVLGGINVVVDEPFTANGYDFPAGENYMDGAKALVFVRDRYHQSGGDRDRGKNQMKVITAVINKALSPQIITNYMSILSSVEGSFQTSLESKQITSLVQMQLNDMSSWNITEQRVDGNGIYGYSPALGFDVYLMVPDQTSMASAKQNMQTVMNK